MKDRAQLKGYAAIFAQAFFLFCHFSGPRSIATDLKPIGQVQLNKSDVLSHPGIGHVRLLGLERPSNITQPFELLTPAESFFPAVMDGFLYKTKSCVL